MKEKIKEKVNNIRSYSLWTKIFWIIFSVIILAGLSLAVFFYTQHQKVSLQKKFYANDTYVINDHQFYYGPNDFLEDLDSYINMKRGLVASGEDLLDVNLNTMKLSYYRGGEKILERSVAGKGRPGGWWETPPGVYKMMDKRKKVKVAASPKENPIYMPYAMRYSGMFFIHAIPEFEDGSNLSGYYTEGCVRLEKTVAEEVYSLSKTGTIILIHDEKKDDFEYNKYDISSDVFIAADLLNNETLFAKNADSIVKMGDITKFLLYLAATDWVELPFDRKVWSIDYQSEKQWIKVGNTYRMFDLGFPLLARKSNQVASEVVKRFQREPVETMKKKAESVGMKNVYISNPLGDKFENTASITDMVLLLKYIYKSRDFILSFSRGKIKDEKYGYPVWNVSETSKFSSIDGYRGGMTSDSFGEDIEYGVGVFEINVDGSKRPIGIVVYDSVDVEKDVRNILKKIKAFYSHE